MEYNSFCVLALEFELVLKVPCNSLSLTVFIRCQVNGFRLGCQSFKLAYNLLFVCRNYILGLESLCNVNA